MALSIMVGGCTASGDTSGFRAEAKPSKAESNRHIALSFRAIRRFPYSSKKRR